MASFAAELASGLTVELESLREVARSGASGPRAVYIRLLESVFLNGVTELESFIEDLFFAIVSGQARPRDAKPIVRLHNDDTARRMVLRPREAYAKWLPI